jgi:mRNA interferase RelE/StbE
MSQYSVYVIPVEFQAIKKLPGKVRQRVKRAIDALADNPRPSDSKELDTGINDAKSSEYEVRRVRVDNWRIVYLITEVEKMVDVVAVRKRPPYDYGDLAELLSGRGKI